VVMEAARFRLDIPSEAREGGSGRKEVLFYILEKPSCVCTPETHLTFSLMFQLAVASSNIGNIMTVCSSVRFKLFHCEV
jgi:hypothetical protein